MVMVSQAHVIPVSRLEECERNLALFSNLFQTSLAHDNNEILNCFLFPPSPQLSICFLMKQFVKTQIRGEYLFGTVVEGGAGKV